MIAGSVFGQGRRGTTSNILCNSWLGEGVGTGGGKQVPRSVDTSRCAHLYGLSEQYHDQFLYQKAYDTAREYINECAQLSTSWDMFQSLDGYNSARSDDYHRFDEYREWLKKVLYYNTDTLYYCADVTSILTTFSWFNDVRGRDTKGALAVDSFIVKSGKCPDLVAWMDTLGIPSTWNQAYTEWLDTVDDPVKTPFDSTLPTLEDLGLGILRGQLAVREGKLPSHSFVIGSLIATENPFTNETALRFDLGDGAFLKLEIFDVLGKPVFSDAKFFSQGENKWLLEGKDIPRGELYARVSTLNGEVHTIKLRHT